MTSDSDEHWDAARQKRFPALPASGGGPETAAEGVAGSNSGRGGGRVAVFAQVGASPAASAGERGSGRRMGPGF